MPKSTITTRVSSPMVGEAIGRYLLHTKREQSARTYEGRSLVLNAFAAAHPALLVMEAKPWHLQLWINAQATWKSDWTKRRAVSTIQCCFNWAVRLGMIDRNPFKGISHPEGEPGRSMTDSEFRLVLRNSSAPFRRLMMFLRYTGCRPGEASAIDRSHIDLDRRLVILSKHKTAHKTRKPRVIVLHEVAYRLVCDQLRRWYPDQEKLFVNSRGNPWNRFSISCRWKRLRADLDLPADCRPYGLRHKFCTDAIKAGVNIKVVSVLAGHRNVRTTERYVHVEDDIALLTEAVKSAVSGHK